MTRRAFTAFAALPLAALFLLAMSPASASAAPAWKLTVTPNADYFLPGPAEVDVYTIEAENIGNEPTSGAIKLEDILPAGFTGTGLQFFASPAGLGINLAEGLCPGAVECEFPGALSGSFPSIAPGQRLIMQVRVGVPPGALGAVTDAAKIRGGAAAKVTAGVANEVNPEPPIGFHSFLAPLTNSSAGPYTQAGGHPYQLTNEFRPTTKTIPALANENWRSEGISPVFDPKDVAVELPPGLIGNPQGVPHCELSAFFFGECPISTVVGTAAVTPFGGYNVAPQIAPLFNLEPSGAYPGELGYKIYFPFFLTAHLRSGSDYGITLTDSGTPPAAITHVLFTTWGVPADPSHDAMRGKACVERLYESVEQAERQCEGEDGDFGNLHGGPAGVPPSPFLTMPTRCSGEPLTFGIRYNVWEIDGLEASASTEDPPVDGCNALNFEPQIEARPTTNLADAPSGLEFNLEVPQNEDPEGVATSDLKEAVVRLPQGVTLNPSSANGLTSCSEAEVGLHIEGPASCPDAAKIGRAEVETALLHEPLKGYLYLATPYQNPSGSLLAGYIVLEGQGVTIKLPGSFETDPQTGQITASFLENPQLPFEELRLHLFEGSRGAIRTPTVCGSYETTSALTPYSAPESGPPATPTAVFSTTAAENGGACPTAAAKVPYAPLMHAGTETPQAGIYSPFSLRLVREDGTQEVKGLETTLPPGLVGRLAGVSYCPDAALAAAAGRNGLEEKATPSCPASSEVGTVDVSTGAGPTPLYVSGHAYLSGPYKGAPLSLAIVTPAVAGPFDLGTVVVRAALYVNPETTQITAKSDQIPNILAGIPLDIRSVTLKLNRSQFTRNPTSCEESHFTGNVTSIFGSVAPLEDRFQVGGCPALGFKPKLALSVTGGTKRRGHPALRAVLSLPAGGANIARAQVALPPTEILDNAHIQSPCTRVEFSANACPPGSILGSARAETPLLDQPLEGPVYLMTGFGHKLPDLIVDLNGQIRVILDGRVDSAANGGLRNTFEVVPDAPVSKFVLSLQGGGKGLLQNTTDICQSTQRATVLFSGQNGKRVELNPALKAHCPKSSKKRNKAHPRATRGHGAR